MDGEHDIQNIVHLFSNATHSAPDAIAVDHKDGTLTYCQLDEASDILSDELLAQHVRPKDPVILLTAHGTRNIIAVLAILKAGATYVPIDRDTWSEQRVAYVISTMPDNSLILNTTAQPFSAENSNVHNLNDIRSMETKALAGPHVRPSIDPEDTACIIFTSGSTGRPKGVMLTHRAISNYAQTTPFNMQVKPGDRVLHILSVAFDASTGMLFSILGNCGTVVPSTLSDLYEKAVSCSILASTPSILASLPLPSVQDNPYTLVHTILLGGESPPVNLLRGWLEVGVKILNAYGPTETTCASTIHVVERDNRSGGIRNGIIGEAMRQCPAFLLDKDDELVDDDDVDGEIVVQGCSLAKGYYRDPDRTEANFGLRRGRRTYRTGDVGRWTRSNNNTRVLEFRGRKDRTVKVRGFLVNLEADVEVPIQRIGEDVDTAFATIHRDKLVALVAPVTVDVDALKLSLECQLSTYHVPDHLVPINQFSLSPNGKIDPKQVAQFLEQIMPSEELNVSSSGGLSSDIIRQHLATVLRIKLDELRPEDDFFAKGGNSLDAVRLCSLCRNQGIRLTPADVYTGRTLAGILGETNKRAEMMQRDALNGLEGPRSAREGLNEAPLTPQQLEFCTPTVECSGRCTNQVRKAYRYAYVEILKSAWKTVWDSESLFHTEISLDTGLGVQIVRPYSTFLLIEKQTRSREEYEAEVQAVGLEVGCGMRFDLISYVPEDETAAAGEATLIWTVHHALLDGFSLALILGKVEQAAKGIPLLQSSSFLNAAQNLITLQHERDREARAFWSAYLAGFGTEISRIPRRTEQVPRSTRAEELRFDMSSQENAICALAASAKVTVATIYYTAWAIALCTRTSSLSIVVGAVHSGRQSMMDYMDAVGPLMATLPLLVRLRPVLSVADQLNEVMTDLSVCAEYAWSKPDQINHRLSNLVATQYDFPQYEESIPCLGTQYFENSDFPLSLLVDDHAQFRLVFDIACFSDGFVSELASDFMVVVDRLLVETDISACLLHTGSGKDSGLNTPLTPSGVASAVTDVGSDECWDSEPTLSSEFEASVDLHADLIAIESPYGCLTYAELDALANAVSQEIRASCGDTSTIAIYADGSIEWIVGVLGILKAGYAYCPIDPAYSLERRLSVYVRSGAGAIVIPHSFQLSEVPRPARSDPVITVESISRDPDRSRMRLRHVVNPSSDALIVFTSGTTGQPKGVPISHRGLLALQSNPEATMFSRPGLRIAQFMSPAFDYCANETFSALLHGATLVMRDPCDPNAHLLQVEAATITPSVLGVLDPQEFKNLRILYATGEPVPPALVNLWAPGRLFYNAYGPAECSICTSFTRLVPDMPVTIGRPIRTARMYVLDADLRHVETGVQGEIFLAGVQVMRGYIGADDQTKQRVLPDPWFPGSNMYRTGDYGYLTKDGNIFYVGRLDRQVKVRGYRVELPTIEQKMYELEPAVQLAAVLPVNGSLIAFVKPQTVNVSSLLRKLSATLQPSWVPQRIIALDELPTTVNRKVDFGALIQKGSVTTTVTEVPKPQDRIEELIADQWVQVLELPEGTRISGCEHLLSLGGHSVLLMLLSVRLSKVFSVKVSVKDILSALMLREQATMIRRLLGEISLSKAAECPRLCERQLTHLERQAWFQYQVGTSTTTFNIPILLHIDGEIDHGRLADAFDAAMATRKLLRSNFIATKNGPVRLLRNASPRTRRVETLDVERELHTAFDLEKDELIRVHMYNDSIMIVVSHAIADLNSVHTLLRQASRIYQGEAPGEPRFAYLGSAIWNSSPTEADKDYWVRTLRGAPEVLSLDSEPSSAVFEGCSRTRLYSGKLIEQLSRVMARHTVTKHQTVCTAVAQALQYLCHTDDVILGAPYGNRHSESDTESVGLFLDRIPLRIRACPPSSSPPATGENDDRSAGELLRATRAVSQDALAHAVPFHELMAMLGVAPTLERHPIFQAMVTFHLQGATERSLNIPGCTVRREPCFPPGAKFLLMFEWTELGPYEWSLRIEYDSTRVGTQLVRTLEDALEIVLVGLAAEATRETIRRDLFGRLGGAEARQEGVHHGPMSTRRRVVETIRMQMASCLGIDIGEVSDSFEFFNSGADSLTAYRLFRCLKRAGLEVPITWIFDSPTPESLADMLLYDRGVSS